MTATCESCVHWDDQFIDYGQHVPEGEAPRWGTCRLIGLPEYSERVTRPAFVVDGSHYAADLHCRSDFGCILHSAAEVSGET